MNTLLLRDVRCFRGDHSAQLAPLTILVGENSTGKSTLLALVRAAWDVAYGFVEPDFNETPFQLGSYHELAHYHGGQGKRATSFSVGFHGLARTASRRSAQGGDSSLPPENTRVVGTFSASADQPALSGVRVSNEDWSVEARSKDGHIALTLSTPSGEFPLDNNMDPFLLPLNGRSLAFALDYVLHGQRLGPAREPPSEASLPTQREVDTLARLLSPFRRPPIRPSDRGSATERPLAIAPIRSRPSRTYDPLKESRSPEGDHVPMLLARLSAADQTVWTELAAELSAYGAASGLFERVVVRRLAKSGTSPFQLQVKLRGQQKEVNLLDVGYGVSQVLPILVDALTEKQCFFLMQQPEVHLHPRAQAELGTLVTDLVGKRRHRFIIETHSDYFLDRIRLEVKRRRIRSDVVSILFMERVGSQVQIHRIALDSGGNITGQPDGYRQFFLEEGLRIIS